MRNLDGLLAEWRRYYNWERPHSTHHGKSPMDRYFDLADKLITVNPDIRKVLKLKDGVVQPAFLPPDTEIEPELPGEIIKWLDRQKAGAKKILAANAFRIEMHEGQDLYGIDLCIRMMRTLVHEHALPVALIFVVSSLDRSSARLEEYQHQVKELGLEDHVLLTCTKLSFVRLLANIDIVLRPTCTDGDALTVREALHFNKPVIASDVVTRPQGTILFRNRNAEDLTTKVLNLLSDQEQAHNAMQQDNKGTDFYRNN